MQTALPQIVLLPGLDGTGELFAGIVAALPGEFQTRLVRYPALEHLSYSELLGYACDRSPEPSPFVILAESFSTPLAIRWAALNPRGLNGLILCAGFARSPVPRWARTTLACLAPLVVRNRIPRFVLRAWLVGPNAPVELVETVRGTIASVSSAVLATRAQAVLSCDVRRELLQIRAPICYICASNDRLVRPSSFKEIIGIRPDVTVSHVAGPHLILQAAPMRCAEVVAAHVRTWIQR